MYDGEAVTSTLVDDGALTVEGPAGDVRATGLATLGDPPPVVDIPAAGPPPDEPPAVTEELLEPGTVLGSLHLGYHRDQAAAYLADIRESHPIYERGAVCHPGFLARQANYVLSRNVRLGPWIHVETTAWHRGLVVDGNEVEVRGRVADRYDRNEHRFVDLDVEITADGAPVWSARHTAIWHPRAVSSWQ